MTRGSGRWESATFALASVATLALSAAPQSLAAQSVGTITGTVTDRDTRQPLLAAQVQVVGTPRGAATDEQGAYRILGVPAGTVTLRVRRIGYQSIDVPVTVTAGGTVTQNFTIGRAAAQLEQVVVTATGETRRRVESGAATSTIDSSRMNLAATTNFSQALAARAPGVTVSSPGGTSGTGSRIRIRGSNSLSLSNDPLIIVDGVLLGNSSASTALGVGGQTISRFDDINPEEIENIEVVKGPAATALYGTAAANGVIQITTKRGRPGATRWSLWSEYGSQNEITEYPSNFSQIGRRVSDGTRVAGCSIDQQARNICRAVADSLASHNPLETYSVFRTGSRNTLGLSASGGASGATYFLSGEAEREAGITQPNNIRRIFLRSNINAQLLKSLTAQVNASVLRGRTRLPFNDNTSFGLISVGLLGKAFDCSPSTYRNIPTCGSDSSSRGYFNANVPPQDFFVDRRQQEITRFVGGLTATWTPRGWLSVVGRGGADLANRYDQILQPPNRIRLSQATLEGSRGQFRAELPTYSGNLTATATFNLADRLTSATSVGGQYQNEIFRRTDAQGFVLLPGTESLAGSSARFAVNEVNQEVRTIGGYAEQRFSFADRLFLTAAVRGDDNSAFGRDFPVVYYPAFNASWVVSEESFFSRPTWLNQLRLRAAYGRSGQRPGFRQAETFFSGVAFRVDGAELPAVTVGGTGNTALRPEISAETEGGFDLQMFDGRLGLEVTAYTRRTKDLLVNRVLAPSLGATLNQFVNLAGLQNRGLEVAFNATPIDMRRFRYESNVAFTANRNKVTGLGEGIQPIIFSFNSVQRHVAGYPAGGYWQRKILGFEDRNADGIISRVNCPAYGGVANPQVANGPACEVTLSDSVEFLGGWQPTREVAWTNTFGLFDNTVRLSSLLNYRGGWNQFNSTREFRCGTIGNCREIQDRNAPLADQAKAVARLMGTNAGYIEKGDFLRLSEVALTFALPDRLTSRIGKINGATLTLAGRNLALWSDYSGFDPEVNSLLGVAGASGLFGQADFLAQPPTRFFSARLGFNF